MSSGHAPLFHPASLEHTVVADGSGAISRDALLRDAARLAECLPAGADIVNVCRGRYHFMVAFVAALLREAHCILPGDPAEASLEAATRRCGAACVLTDAAIDTAGLPAIRVDRDGLAANRTPPIPKIPLDRDVATVFSSGSTGAPVSIRRTWRWMLGGARHYLEELGLQRLDGARIVATVPSQHSYGLEAAIMLPLRHAAAVYDAMPFYPADIATALEAVPPPRVLVTTPLHLRILIESAVALPAVAVIVSATAPLPRSLAEEAEARTGAILREVYGCSEVGLVATRRTAREDFWTAPDDMTVMCNDGGASVTVPHLPARVELADVIEPLAGSRFRLIGRSEDMVKIAGKRASLTSLNSQLAGIDGVDDGVFFLPPGDGMTASARLTAFVVAPHKTDAEILRALRGRIPAPFLPRPLVRVSRIPRNATGKVRYEDLIDLSKSERGQHG